MSVLTYYFKGLLEFLPGGPGWSGVLCEAIAGRSPERDPVSGIEGRPAGWIYDRSAFILFIR